MLRLNPKTPALSEGKTLFLVFLFALVIRMIFITTLEDGYYFSDSARYEEATRHILQQGSYPDSYNRAPLYPAFLAGVYATVGDEIFITRSLQAALSGTIALLITLIGFRFGGYWVGTFAGVLWSIYPMAVFLAGTIYPATLLTLLMSVGVFCLMPGSGAQPGLLRLALSGFIFGLCALAKPVVLVAIGTIGLWLMIFQRENRIAGAFVFGLAALLAITPWTIRNYEVHGRLVPIESRGLNELVPWAQQHNKGYLDNLQTQAAVVAALRQKLTEEQIEALGKQIKARMDEQGASTVEQLEPKENQSQAETMAKGMVARFPGEFVSFFELYPRRVGFLEQSQRDKARADKNPRLVENIPFGNNLVNMVSAFAVSFLYVFAVLGIVAMWLSRLYRAYLWLYLGLVLSFAVGYATSWGKIRYRVPVDPYIIMLSAWGLYWSWNALANRATKSPDSAPDSAGKNTLAKRQAAAS